MQLSLLGDTTYAEPVKNQLRDYQVRISEQAVAFLGQGKSPLIVMATGTGKTRTAADIVHRLPGRVLWVAHRIELVRQAVTALEHELGESVGVEEPGRFSGRERVIVASKDTVRTHRRLGRLDDMGTLSAVLFDECHHSAAASYQAIANAFPGALRIGLTATPGRLDKRRLALFDSMTEPYGIVRAIDDGWLVPIHAKRVKVKSVDLSQVGTVAGDFNQAELDEVMRSEESIHGIVHGILGQVHLGPVLSFATSVSVAERQCEILNRYRPGIARFVCGNTATSVRHQTFADFGRSYQVLVNVGVATEGTDLPTATVVAMGRPTKSATLFQQMLGRVLRPLPGVDNATSRKDWIAASKKPYALVLDFCNNSGRHSVRTALHGLALDSGSIPGKHSTGSAPVHQLLDSGNEIDVLEALRAEAAREQKRVRERDERRSRDRARRVSLRGTAELSVIDVRMSGMGLYHDDTVAELAPTPGQQQELRRLGISGRYDTARDARRAIANVRQALDLATVPQVAMLLKHVPDQVKPDLTKKRAGWLISSLIKKWRRK